MCSHTSCNVVRCSSTTPCFTSEIVAEARCDGSGAPLFSTRRPFLGVLGAAWCGRMRERFESERSDTR